MAKVTTKDENKLPGKPGVSSAGVQSKGNEVKAVRNGVEQTFTRQIWDHLPADKDGYQEISEAPKSAQTSKQKTEAGNGNAGDTGKKDDNVVKLTAKEQKDAYKESAEEYKSLFGEGPGQDLSTEEIIALIDEKKLAGNGNAGDEGKGGTE